MINPVSNLSYLLPPLIAAFVTIVLLVLVWQKSRRDVSSRIFFCLLLALGLWDLLVFAMRSSPNLHQAVLWSRAVAPAGFAAYILYYHFSCIYTGVRRHRAILLGSYLLLIIAASLIPTPLVVDRMIWRDYGYASVPGPITFLLVVVGLSLMGGGAYNVVRRYNISQSDEERNRLLYLLIAPLFPLTGALIDGFSDLPPLAIWGNLIFCIICSVAILKYHLLDIRVVVRKSLVYLLVSIVIAIPYVGILYLLHFIFKPILESWWVHPIIILLLAIILRPLYSRAQGVVDRLFYRDRYDYLKALEQFSQKAQSVSNLKELSSTLTQLVSGALRASSACLLLPSESDNGLIAVSSTGLDSPPSGVVLRNRSPLIKWLKLQQLIVFSEEFNIVPQLQSLSLREKNNLEQMEANLYVPIQTSPGQLSGILVLGQKLSQQPYSSEDRQLLTALSSQMAIALENARLYNDALQARQNLEAWLNSMTDPVMIVNMDYSVQFMNKAALEHLGASGGGVCWEALGKDAECSGCPIQRYHRDSREGYCYANSIADRQYDVAVAPLLNPDGGTSIIEVFRDITERKRMEEEIRVSGERYRHLFENLNDAAILADAETGQILETNRQGEVLLGRSRNEIIGMHQSALYPPDKAEEYKQRFAAHVAKGRTADYEGEVIRKDGTIIPVYIGASPLTIQGHHLILGLFHDITERKQAEEREKELQQELHLSSRLASIGELAAGVAHEINNPLTGIVGFSQRLLRKNTDEEARQDLEIMMRDLGIIHSEARRAAKVVENLLTFARRREPKKQYSDISEIVHSALELRAYELKTSNIEVITDLAPSLPQIMVDFHQIQEVFLNIILNAEQVMTEAHVGGKLTIKTEEKRGYIRTTFTDDGPGIAREYLDKIFDPFFSTKGERGGTGLGLSVCHGIISEHGGRIYAKSKPGKGATFFVELPIIAEE